MNLRVYYEDTDAAGVVYHASYLRFFERARTEYFRERGIFVAELAAHGHIFPVVRMEIDFKAPALHDDILSIVTIPERTGGSTITLRQQALRPDDRAVLVDARVTLACVGPSLKPRRIPLAVRQALEAERALSASP